MTSGDMVLTITDNDEFQLRLDKTSGKFQSDFDFLVNPDSESTQTIHVKYIVQGSKGTPLP
jgi:hypothetical protein